MTKNGSIQVRRLPLQLRPDPKRVITRLFLPETEERLPAVVKRLLALDEEEVTIQLAAVMADFSTRHRDIEEIFGRHFDAVAQHMDALPEISRAQKFLIGAYFTSEYSVESVALFNYARNRETEKTAELYRWFLPLLRLDTVPKFVQLIKLVQGEVGMGNARVRPPRLELEGDELAEARAVIDEAMKNRPVLQETGD